MARIRTIKPEFPQSESMGRISRDARLLFIQMWTLADDSGRLRGNSRMLASLLFPYDDDAPSLIDGWVAELEAERCLDRYIVDRQSYIQIANWLIHQKIDKPSASKIPGFDESSRSLAKNCSGSRTEGPRTKEGKGEGVAPSVLVGEESPTDDAKPKPLPNCPHQKLIEVFHEVLPTLSRVNSGRWAGSESERAMQQRWLEGLAAKEGFWRFDDEVSGLERWREFCGIVGDSEFLMGRKTEWRADLHWLVKRANFDKTLSNRYHVVAA